jgi:formylglycine-generating enzyme required for sulfatase activity
VADWFDDKYYARSQTDNPAGPSSGANRVYRGGGWWDDPWFARAAIRLRNGPFNRSDSLGFRLAASPGQR